MLALVPVARRTLETKRGLDTLSGLDRARARTKARRERDSAVSRPVRDLYFASVSFSAFFLQWYIRGAPTVGPYSYRTHLGEPTSTIMSSFLPSPYVPLFGAYITKVGKQVHPDHNLSFDCLKVVDSLLVGVRNQLASGASASRSRDVQSGASPELALNESHVKSAVQFLLAGELAKHAIKEGQKRVTELASLSDEGLRERFLQGQCDANDRPVFPSTAVHHFLQSGGYAPRVDIAAGVDLAMTLEYLSAEIIELAGNQCRDENAREARRYDDDDNDDDNAYCNNKTVEVRHVAAAIENDEELALLFSAQLARGPVQRLTIAEYKAVLDKDPRALLCQDFEGRNPLDRARINDVEDEVIKFLEGMFTVIMSVNELYPDVSDEEFKEKLELWDDL